MAKFAAHHIMLSISDTHLTATLEQISQYTLVLRGSMSRAKGILSIFEFLWKGNFLVRTR